MAKGTRKRTEGKQRAPKAHNYKDGEIVAFRTAALRSARQIRGLSCDIYNDCAQDAVEKVLTASSIGNPKAYAEKVARNRALRFQKSMQREAATVTNEAEKGEGCPLASGRRAPVKLSRMQRSEIRDDEKRDVIVSARSQMLQHLSYFVERRIIFQDAEKERDAYHTLKNAFLLPLLSKLEQLGHEPPTDFVDKLVAFRRRYFPRPGEVRGTRGKRPQSVAEYVAEQTSLGLGSLFLNECEVTLPMLHKHGRHGAAQVAVRRVVDYAFGLCGLHRAYDLIDAKSSSEWSSRKAKAIAKLEESLGVRDRHDNAFRRGNKRPARE